MWSNTNLLIVSWLLTYVSSSIAGMVESINSVAHVWKVLTGMYYGAGSVMMMEVEEKIDATTQEEKSVHQYAAELRSLWANLDHYDPLILPNPTDILSGRQYLERRRVARFLKGLNVLFETRTAAMCHLPSLPSLDEAIASMEQEEIRQKVMTGEATPVVCSALVVPATPAREDGECYNCEKKGHLSYNCLKLHNTGGGRGGKGQRGEHGGREGRGRGGRGVAHLAVADDFYNTTKANAAEMTEMEELRRFKLQVENSKGNLDDIAAHFGNFAGYAHVNKGIQALASTKSHVDWIINSGASRHVTGTSSEFIEYHPSKYVCPETVQTTDETSQPHQWHWFG
jgi:Retrotransposon gag protein